VGKPDVDGQITRTSTRNAAIDPVATKEGQVPLSEHEQRLLDEIEQALYAEDPKFASAVRSARAHSRLRRSVVLCALGVVVGLGLVLVGLLANIIALSVVGFVLVVGAFGYGAQTLRARTANPGPGRSPARAPRSGGLRSRMEDRLRRRFDEN
jgi:Protein of unknown function (DUF3040)